MGISYSQKNRRCFFCNKVLATRHQVKYCSQKCQFGFQRKTLICLWQKDNNNELFKTRNISAYIKNFLIKKYKNKCSQCGWNKVHPITNKVPLEIHHIDGNAKNNSEENLRLLCPNCHSLTPHFRNLNKGNGRGWRSKKQLI